VARLRKQLAAQAPPLPRGRPAQTPVARRCQRRALALRQRVTELFDHRHLFVRHGLTACQQKTLQRLIRGQSQLRALREIMDEVYRLFDRRCRTETALEKLSRLRRRVQRFKSLGKSLDKLKSPNLEKALTFLDDKLLPATSNVSRYRPTREIFRAVGVASYAVVVDGDGPVNAWKMLCAIPQTVSRRKPKAERFCCLQV
jgi:hypothetical protein